MSAYNLGAEIADLRRAALSAATVAVRAGEDLDLVRVAFEEEYRNLAGAPLHSGAWERLARHARVCAAWLPHSVPEPAPPAPEMAPAQPELPPGWRLEKCDHTGYVTSYGVYWCACGPDGQRTDASLHPHGAAVWARHMASDVQDREQPEEWVDADD